MKKYRSFLSKHFQFLEVKFSIYLNRRVFVMRKRTVIAYAVVASVKELDMWSRGKAGSTESFKSLFFRDVAHYIMRDIEEHNVQCFNRFTQTCENVFPAYFVLHICLFLYFVLY